jgi:hypothetical protein
MGAAGQLAGLGAEKLVTSFPTGMGAARQLAGLVQLLLVGG